MPLKITYYALKKSAKILKCHSFLLLCCSISDSSMYSSIESSCFFLNELLKKEKTFSTAADEEFTGVICMQQEVFVRYPSTTVMEGWV